MRWIGSLSLIFSLAIQAQYYRIVPPPAWVNEISIEGLVLQDTACSIGGTEYLLSDRQFHLGEERSYYRLVTRLTSINAVQNGSRIEVDVDPSYQQLELHSANVIRNGKVIDQLSTGLINVLQRERDLNAFLYDGTRSVVLELQGVLPGDIIERSFTVIGNDAAGDGRFSTVVGMGHSVPLARQHLRFIVPKGRELHFKGHLFDEPAEVINGRWGTEHVWHRHDLPCLLHEDGYPGWYSPYPELQATEFTDLEDLRQWAVKQFDVDMRLNKDLQSEVEKLKRLPDPMARIDSAIHIVQRQVRYLGLEGGISAYRPKPPATVYSQRFGDCKDRSLLLVALLRAIDVNAWPVLVNTTMGRTLDRHLPRSGMFDHCIALIEHEGEHHWVDPTMSNDRGRLKDRYTPDMGLALVIDPNASGWLPMPNVGMGTLEVTEHFTLDSVGGGATLDVTTRYTRREADRIRGYFAGQSNRIISEQYRDFYLRSYGEGSILEPVRMEDDVVENVVHTYERYKLDRIWDSLSTGGIQFAVSPDVLKDYVIEPQLRTRISPLQLYAPIDVVQNIILEMPEDWPVDIVPQDISGYGISYKSNVRNDGARVEMNYHYRSDSLIVHAEDMPAFHAQQQEILGDMQMLYSYSDPESAVIDAPKAAVILLFILGSCIYGGIRLFRWDPAPHPDALGAHHTTIGGWMVLPLIGLCLSPILMVRDMLADDWIFEAPMYVPLDGIRSVFVYHVYNYFTIVHAVASLCLVVLAIFLFIQRRTSTPKIMIAIYIISLAVLALDMVFYEWLRIGALTGEVYDGRDLGRALFAAVIWVPFFFLSKRVHTTFVKRYKDHPQEHMPMAQERTFSDPMVIQP